MNLSDVILLLFVPLYVMYYVCHISSCVISLRLLSPPSLPHLFLSPTWWEGLILYAGESQCLRTTGAQGWCWQFCFLAASDFHIMHPVQSWLRGCERDAIWCMAYVFILYRLMILKPLLGSITVISLIKFTFTSFSTLSASTLPIEQHCC